jgi:hypothetical protein
MTISNRKISSINAATVARKGVLTFERVSAQISGRLQSVRHVSEMKFERKVSAISVVILSSGKPSEVAIMVSSFVSSGRVPTYTYMG